MDCPICDTPTLHLDTVNFNKSCSDAGAKFFEPTNLMIDYRICPTCGFAHAPEMMTWPVERFKSAVYNDAYCLVDPEYLYVRPHHMAGKLIEGFGRFAERHLDYGGGTGRMSSILYEAGWNTESWDPVVDKGSDPTMFGQFDFITAIEVFEHVPSPHALMTQLRSLLRPGGFIMFTTLLSDGHIEAGKPLDWWYAAPRNGHIGLFSAKSLALLGEKHGFTLTTVSEGTHLFSDAVGE